MQDSRIEVGRCATGGFRGFVFPNPEKDVGYIDGKDGSECRDNRLRSEMSDGITRTKDADQ